MNATLSGHWYCSFCNDVVNIRKPFGRWDERRGQPCPVCRHNSAEWVSDSPPARRGVSPERAAELFMEVKSAVKN